MLRLICVGWVFCILLVMSARQLLNEMSVEWYAEQVVNNRIAVEAEFLNYRKSTNESPRIMEERD